MEQNNPTLEFAALAALPEEERAAAIAAYTAAVEAKAAENAGAQFKDELTATRLAAAKYRMATEGGLSGFGERMAAIEQILESTPALGSLPDEEKLRTAYYIDRGMHASDAITTEALLAKVQADPEAMRAIEAAVLEKLRAADVPSLRATSGTASVPVTPQKKPKSIEEASALAREAFGI